MPDSNEDGKQSLRPVLLFWLGCAAALFYLGWNVFWLIRGRVPPAISLGIFGIPAPTTGMTRSLSALFAGNLRESLLWNPLSVPTLILYLGTIGYAVHGRCTRRRVNLPQALLWTWGVVLGVAWIAKFLIGPDRW